MFTATQIYIQCIVHENCLITTILVLEFLLPRNFKLVNVVGLCTLAVSQIDLMSIVNRE